MILVDKLIKTTDGPCVCATRTKTCSVCRVSCIKSQRYFLRLNGWVRYGNVGFVSYANTNWKEEELGGGEMSLSRRCLLFDEVSDLYCFSVVALISNWHCTKRWNMALVEIRWIQFVDEMIFQSRISIPTFALEYSIVFSLSIVCYINLLIREGSNHRIYRILCFIIGIYLKGWFRLTLYRFVIDFGSGFIELIWKLDRNLINWSIEEWKRLSNTLLPHSESFSR